MDNFLNTARAAARVAQPARDCNKKQGKKLNKSGGLLQKIFISAAAGQFITKMGCCAHLSAGIPEGHSRTKNSQFRLSPSVGQTDCAY
jgi:hypothetical protein